MGSEAKDGAALRLRTSKQQKTRTLDAANVVDTTGIFLRSGPAPIEDGKEATAETVVGEEAEEEAAAAAAAAVWTEELTAAAAAKECNEEEEEPMVGDEEAEEGKETAEMTGGRASEAERSPAERRPLVCLSSSSILRARSS